MFVFFLLALMGIGYVHGRFVRPRPTHERHELVLVYLLAGYCGVIMVGVCLWGIFDPSAAAGMLGTEPGNPFQEFFLVAYLGMSVMATLSIWIRGTYLLANVICWSIYWLGATVLHFIDYYEAGSLSLRMGIAIFAAHALVAVLMVLMLSLAHQATRRIGAES